MPKVKLSPLKDNRPQTLAELATLLRKNIPWCDVIVSDPDNEGCITIRTNLQIDKPTDGNNDQLHTTCATTGLRIYH